MRIGTRKYFADITSRGVSIFVNGVKRNFYPWGAGIDSEARNAIDEVNNELSNYVKKNETESQTAGLFLKSMNVGESQYPGWRVKTDVNESVVSFAALGNDGYSGTRVNFSADYATDKAEFHVVSQSDKNQIVGNANTTTTTLDVKRENNYIKLYVSDNGSYVHLNHKHASGTQSYMRLQNNASANTNKFYFETEYKPTSDNSYKMRYYLDTQTIKLTKNGTTKNIDLWDLADLLINP